ncbi:Uncharacterised protein [Nocardia otitidiscaviarum]|uniref:Uncharacterized protein n=2 Tax=Nocardia otitidiscaviarum TaxID=1823 RepID=A0A378YW56_9NOCA|nr:Uncharacterised protein [Nocardia otitidiscaviarum]
MRAREIAAAALGMGSPRMSGAMPSGHFGTRMPEQMYLITAASAVLDGQDLGNPVRLAENPVIGAVAVPARGVLVIGGGRWRIRTPDVSAR